MSAFRSDLFEGKVALVTGGGSGIGRGIVAALVEHGATVAIMGRNAERLEATAAELGSRCVPLAGDVRDADAVTALVEGLVARCGRLDVLVNGAAGNFLAPAATLSSKGFRTVLEIEYGPDGAEVSRYEDPEAAWDSVTPNSLSGYIKNVACEGQRTRGANAASIKAFIDGGRGK